MISKEEFQLIWHLEHGNVRVEMLAHFLKKKEEEVLTMLKKLQQEGYIDVAMTTNLEGKEEINYALPTDKARPLFTEHKEWEPEDRGF
jgi:Mn-dependent DtxR family transcriptional regulator